MSRAIDDLISFDGRSYEYALRGRGQRVATPPIRFCPWCGALLFRTRVKKPDARPASKRKKRVAKRKR